VPSCGSAARTRSAESSRSRAANAELTRAEYEYAIPISDASGLIELCQGRVVEKLRFRVPHDGSTWEVDEYLGDNEGLVLTEIELRSEDEVVSIPPWVGREVTGDWRYYAASLAHSPFRAWPGHRPHEER
jgi:adenylate cyclase